MNILEHEKLKIFKYSRPLCKFCWIWIFSWIKISRHACSLWNKLGWFNDSGNLSVRFAVYAKEELPFAQDLSTKFYLPSLLPNFQRGGLVRISRRRGGKKEEAVFFRGDWYPNAHHVLYQLTNVFALGEFNVPHKDWLTCSGGADRPGELCYNFSISNDLIQMFNFPSQIPHCDCYSPSLLDLIHSSDATICSTMAFPPSENSDDVVSVSIDFWSNSKQNALFNRISCNYSCAAWDSLHDDLRDVK